LWLVRRSGWKLYENQKIVLVGHSFGGLVIKSLVVEASRRAKFRARDDFEEETFSRCKNFLENIKATVFYGVPHTGTLIAQYLKDFHRAFPKVQLGDLIRNLQPFQNDMEQLSVDFEEALKRDIMSYAFAETLEYNRVLVVPWASATQLTRHNNMTLYANHIDICKPRSKNDEGYRKLVSFLGHIMKDGCLR
jgi:pimeloyl-ACP methyl ester carboxylesterase